ncbi:MAG: exosortase-associated EpsI family protein [Phycisphaeraceae bacterium]
MNRSSILAALLALALLVGFTAYKRTYPTPQDAQPHLDAVRAAIETVPEGFDGWRSQPVEVPADALDLLQPNKILSRRYIRPDTGHEVTLLIVHCRSARDLAGHYPPVCYPSAGWMPRDQDRAPLATPWAADAADVSQEAELPESGAGTLPFMRYRYSRSSATAQGELDVWNVLLVPGKHPVADMKTVRAQASSYVSHFYGAAQVQFVFPAHILVEEQESIVREFLPHPEPVFDVIRHRRPAET